MGKVCGRIAPPECLAIAVATGACGLTGGVASLVGQKAGVSAGVVARGGVPLRPLRLRHPLLLPLRQLYHVPHRALSSHHIQTSFILTGVSAITSDFLLPAAQSLHR